MKVLYCYRYGILGGVCTQLINRLQVLRASGELEAHLLFQKDYGIAQTLNGYPYLYFEPDPGRVRALAESGGYDAAVVIDTPEYLVALGSVEGLPLITEVHTTVERGLQYLKSRNWETSGYIVPSEYSRWMLRERFGVGREDPVRVVPNSLDRRLFPRVPVGDACARPVFCWVGKLDYHKNWQGFLQVAASMVASGVDAQFWLIGGETAPQDRQDALIDQIEELGLHTRCRWFPRIEYRAMHRAYAAVRDSGGAMIVTSVNESFGMSVLEALFCGCPVVASRVGALPEIMPGRAYLRFYERGALDQAAALAAELMRPRQREHARRELDRDQAQIVSKYSCETVAARYLDALRELVQGDRRSDRRQELAEFGNGEPAACEATPPKTVAVEELPAPPVQLYVPPDVAAAIDELRQRVPRGRWQPKDPAEFLRSFAQMLDQRSYMCARRICHHPRDGRFWLTLPQNLARIVFASKR